MTRRTATTLGATLLFTGAVLAGTAARADATPGHSTTTTTTPRTSSTSIVATTTTTRPVLPPLTTAPATTVPSTTTTACPPGSHPDGPVSPCAWDHPPTTVVVPPTTAPTLDTITPRVVSSTTVPVPTSAQAASGGTVNQPRVGALPATGAAVVDMGLIALLGLFVGAAFVIASRKGRES